MELVVKGLTPDARTASSSSCGISSLELKRFVKSAPDPDPTEGAGRRTMKPGINRWKIVSLYLSSLASLCDPRQCVQRGAGRRSWRT